MNSWHYAIIKHDSSKNKKLHYYAIHEVYRNPLMYSEKESAPYGETREEIIKDLENMLHDAKKYPVLSLSELERKIK